MFHVVVVFKEELTRKRCECHGLTESLWHTRLDLELAKLKHGDQTAELSVANGRIAALEEAIAAQVGS